VVETNNAALEAIWRDLRPHLEWAEGFALVFLFASHPDPVQFLRERLEESLQLRTLKLILIAPATPDQVPRAVEQILAARPDPGHGPLWVEMWRGSAEVGWPQARRQALHRLNERRFLLERDVALPIVLVLPREERGRVYVEAPDLWAVRCFTAELPAPEPQKITQPQHDQVTPLLVSTAPSPAELEWARLLKQAADRASLDPRDGFAAFESAIERGDLAAARGIANETLDIAQRRIEAAAEAPAEPRNAALRDLSISLDNVGQVERDLGNLEAARTAWRESLDLRRRLREAVGDTPQALRDLSVSLERVGQVEGDLGNLEAARTAYREALDLRRGLREALGDTPQALRDLSVSLNNVGQVEGDLGNLEAARSAYRESLDISRRLREALGDTPQALRDLSVSLNNVGQVERDLGNLEAARSAYRESLDLGRRLREAVGDTPQALRDLSVSLNNVGQVEGDLGNLEAARTAYRESLDIARRLREALGDTPQALRDLSVSLERVGQVERDLGNLEAARSAYREALDFWRRLARSLPENAQYQRELASAEARARSYISPENVGSPSPPPPAGPIPAQKPRGLVSRVRELVGNFFG
jgi:tetratricopeptide (TPR) repeat protein